MILENNSAKIMLHSPKIKLKSADNIAQIAYVLFSGEDPYKIALFQEDEVNINGCGFLIPKNYLIEKLEFYISSVKEIESESNMKIKIQVYLTEEGSRYYPLEKAKLEIDLGKKILRTDFIEKGLKIDNLLLNRLSKVITVVSFYSKEEKEEEFFIGGTISLRKKNDAL